MQEHEKQNINTEHDLLRPTMNTNTPTPTETDRLIDACMTGIDLCVVIQRWREYAHQKEHELTEAKKIASELFDIVETFSPKHPVLPMLRAGKEYVHKSKLDQWRACAEGFADGVSELSNQEKNRMGITSTKLLNAITTFNQLKEKEKSE